MWDECVDRRSFLALLAGSLALAGVSGCKLNQPEEKIVPYVRQPEQLVPGEPLYYATAMPHLGYAESVLVTSRMGRPIKIEGNPEHPASLGATNVFAQASLLDLYDPERSKTVLYRGNIATWEACVAAIEKQRVRLNAERGAGLAILTETVTSPTLGEQLKSLLDLWPAARWYQYQPMHRDNVQAGARLAFGEIVTPQYRFDRADVVLSLDCDFLSQLPGSVRYARDFSRRRKVAAAHKRSEEKPSEMSRLFAVESSPTLGGAAADHRWPVRAGDIEALARTIAGRLGVKVADVGGGEHAAESTPGLPAEALEAILGDLQAHRGSSLVIAGDGQPPAVHALVHAINQQLNNVGQTVEYSQPVEAGPDNERAPLSELVDSLRNGDVRTLFIVGGNPMYNAPGELGLAAALTNALGIGSASGDASLEMCLHLSECEDETSQLAHWHIPAAHYLESWSDVRSYDGTVSIVQPLIAPLYGGKTAHELIAALAGQAGRTAYDIVRQYWQQRFGEQDFALVWRRMVHDGLLANSQAAVKQPDLKFADRPTWPAERARKKSSGDKSGGDGGISDAAGVEVVFLPDASALDGRFANNGWLQELPRPLSKLVWDNAALVSAATCQRLGLSNGDVIALGFPGGVTIEAPVWLLPGQADDCIGLTLGGGRTHCGRVGVNVGYNAYPALPAGAARWVDGVAVHKTGRRHRLVATHDHWSMEGRDLVRTVSRQELSTIEPPDKSAHPETLYSQDFAYPAALNKWGMVIDQTACIGCNACIIACQAENNIPIVGKEQVRPRPGDALAARRPLSSRRRWTTRRRFFSRCRACTARTRRASWFVRWRRPCMTPKG